MKEEMAGFVYLMSSGRYGWLCASYMKEEMAGLCILYEGRNG